MKKVLIISHESSRTGAPVLLLNLSHILKENNCEIDYLLKNEGELVPEFQKLGNTTILNRKNKNLVQKIYHKLLAIVLRMKLSGSIHRYDFIISNTLLNHDLDDLLKKNKNVYTYAHELESVLNYYTNDDNIKKVIHHTNNFLYPAKCVKDLLINKYGIANSNFIYLPYFIPDHSTFRTDYNLEMRQKLGYSPSDKIVGGMGALSERKGIDLFIETAQIVRSKNKNVHFLWCGGDPDSNEWTAIHELIKKKHLEDMVKIVPITSVPFKYMAMYDVFFLSSKEDPMPLVGIEAAMMKVPLLFFAKTGGMEEFLGEDSGISVQLGKTSECADKIITIAEGHMDTFSVIENARNKYLSGHSKKVVADIIKQIFNLN